MKNDKNRPTATRDAMQAALDDLRTSGAVPETVPEGWLTTEKWGELLGLARATVQSRVRKLVVAGAWETRKFRIETSRGVMPVPHYRKKPD